MDHCGSSSLRRLFGSRFWVAPALLSLALLAAVGSSSPPSASAAATLAPPLFPAPPAGAVVFSREDVRDVLALGVVRHGSGLLVQVSVLDDQGNGAKGLTVSAGFGGALERAPACGAGCYRVSFPSRKRASVVVVHVRGAGATTDWRVALPETWPAPDGTKLVQRAAAVWRALRSLTFVDRLGSGPDLTLISNWRIVAPDRVAYVIPHGSASVIVGTRRWDRSAAGPWIESAQDPALTQPQPFWVDARDAHILGESVFEGHSVWRVSFFDPGTPGWFDVLLDKKTLHTLDMHMIATAHFMHDTYSNFNGPVVIKPPAS